MGRTLKLVGLVWLGLILILGSYAAANATGTGRQKLHGHVPKAVKNGAQDNGLYDRNKKLWLAIELPWRNPNDLQTLIQNLYDPSSPLYHHYLSTQQFNDAYAPAPEDYEAVKAFAKSKGLQVHKDHTNRLLVDVEGAVPDIENAFNVEIHSYTKTDGTVFYAPDREPSVDLDTPINRIGGLDNANPPHPLYLKRPLNYVSHKIVLKNPQGMAITQEAGYGNGTGTANCAGCYVGNDLRDAYLPGVTLQGSGQVSSIIAVDGYYTSDINTYMSKVGLLNNVTLVNVLVDGFDGNVHGADGNGENSLDIEQQLSLDQGLSQLRVYEGSANIDDDISACAEENIAKTCSASYGWGPDTTLSSLGQEFAAQGQSLFIASGDGGAYVGGESGDSASENPYVTVVGGTDLYTTGPGGSWSSEMAWVDGGGGIGLDYGLPSYQTGISMSNNGGSTTNRNVPDVSMNANFTYLIITYNPSNGSDEADYIGGTSAATPLWAAFTALVNQQAANAGKPTVGFINPLLQTIGLSGNYTADFHDIVSGNNNNSGNGGFNAVAGYDLATGWGSPNGQNAINGLSQAAGAPTATATATFTPVVSSTWRVRAGTGTAYTDCQNNVWSPDENFVGGGENSAANSISGALPCSTDGALYQTERYGNFYYVFHVPNGSYQVTLKFAELFDNGSGERIENISINGTQVLSNFDIYATAGGENIAVDKVFSNIAPSNGAITITVAPTSNSPDQNAKVGAIQIIPMPPTPTFTSTPTATPTFTWTSPPCTTSSLTFGNTSTTNAGSAGVGGQIGGTTYNLSQPLTVTYISLYFASGTTGTGVVGIYSDEGGKPNFLWVQSNAQNVTPGANTFVVTPTVLPAGNYWIYGSFNGTVNWQYSSGCCTGGYLWSNYTYNGKLPVTIAPGSLTGYGWTMCAYASGCAQPTPTATKTPVPLSCGNSTTLYVSSDTSNLVWTNCNVPAATPPADGNGNAWNTANYNTSTASDWFGAQVITSLAGGWSQPCSVANSGITPSWISVASSASQGNGPCNGSSGQLYYYTKYFTVPAGANVTSASLLIAADDGNSGGGTEPFGLYVNGNPISASNLTWTTCNTLNIPASDFHAGNNIIAFEDENESGGQGIAYQLAYTVEGYTCTPTNTMTNTVTVTPTATNTVTLTVTSTSTNSLTPVPPTATNTSTNSPVPPTSTPTVVSTGVTPPPTATNTVTSTATFSVTATWTATAVPPTATNTSTNSPVPPTATYTGTSTWTASKTATPVPPTATWTNSNTPVPPTATFTGTFTWTASKTATPVPPTATSTWTFTAVPPTKTNTPVPPTATATPVPPTATPTSSSACSGVAAWNGNFVYYAAGTEVTYNGELYSCIQSHTSEPNWMPSVVPALWKDMGPCTGGGGVATGGTGCSGVPAWNGNFVAYTVGTQVTYNSELYQCIQSHTSEPNWMPPVVPALWKDMGACTGSALIQSAVAGNNLSRNNTPVKFMIQLSQSAQVTVDLFTTLGQKVAGTTFYGNAGMNNWQWDLRTTAKEVVSSGLYIYAIQATSGGTTQTKTGKVVILH